MSRNLDREPVAHDDDILAARGLAIPILAHEPPIVAIHLLDRTVGLAFAFHPRKAREREQSFRGAGIDDLEIDRAACVRIGIRRLRRRDLQTHCAVALDREVRARVAQQRFRQERLEALRRQRRHRLTAAERRAHHLLERILLRLLIAGSLCCLEFLAGLLDALTPLLELAERAVLVERHVAARVCRRAAQAEADACNRTDHGGDDEIQHDHGDDRDCRVAGRLFLRTLHRVRQAEVEKVDAVDGTREGNHPADSRNDPCDARDPCCSGGVRNRLERLRAIFLSPECRRERIDNERHHEHADEREHVAHDHADQPSPDRRAHGPRERYRRADQAHLDEAREHGDGREHDDVVLVEIAHRGGLARDGRPFRFRLSQDRPYTGDKSVEVQDEILPVIVLVELAS